MAENRHHFKHAEQVIEVARNELDLLLKERRAINKKVKQVKRTVDGLTTLFGRAPVSDRQAKCEQSVTVKIIQQKNEPSVPAMWNVDRGNTAGSEEQENAPSDQGSNSNGFKPKLERACRIALLESEEPATSAQIYDRIRKRGSYNIDRFKHPLVQIIAILSTLADQEEVETIIDGDTRCWRWNGALQDKKSGATTCDVAEQLESV